MGSIEDPENGPAVAGAVFGAVAVYGVSPAQSFPQSSLPLPTRSG